MQCAWQVLVQSANPRANHTFRTLPLSLSRARRSPQRRLLEHSLMLRSRKHDGLPFCPRGWEVSDLGTSKPRGRRHGGACSQPERATTPRMFDRTSPGHPLNPHLSNPHFFWVWVWGHTIGVPTPHAHPQRTTDNSTQKKNLSALLPAVPTCALIQSQCRCSSGLCSHCACIHDPSSLVPGDRVGEAPVASLSTS